MNKLRVTRQIAKCGVPTLETGVFSKIHPSGGALALFAGRRVTFTYKSRVAIRMASDMLGLAPGDEVLAPGYNCGSELDPLLHAGLTLRLYPVNLAAEVDPGAVEARIGPRTRAVYVTHYFGFLQPHLAALRALCDRHGLYLIEDCALSLLSGSQPADGRTGDVAVFCFYKFFPVIAGGALVINRDLPGYTAPLRQAPSGEVARQVLKQGVKTLLGPRLQDTVKALRVRLVEQPEPNTSVNTGTGAQSADLSDMPKHYYFDPSLRDRRLSRLTQRALGGQDVYGAIRRRRENYVMLQELLDGIKGVTVLHPNLPTDVCPLNFPILVPQRDAVARRLVAQGIAANPWWAGYNRHLSWGDTGDARYLKDRLLTLPIDQRLGSDHVHYIANRLALAIGEIG